MLDLLSKAIKNKRVLLLGYGVEGRSTYRLLHNLGQYAALDIADVKAPPDVPEAALVHSGPAYLDRLEDYDFVFKSPGIVLPKKRDEYSCLITSQSEFFLSAFRDQIIGVTGTKGKSTVASLIHHVLSVGDIPCLLAGNIGTPVFDIVDKIKPETLLILELSCHQLEFCSSSPATAIFLNIYEDHLDYYRSFADYFRAKQNIYLHQRAGDSLYCGADTLPAPGACAAGVTFIDEAILPFDSLEALGGVKLRGRHNLRNVAFAYALAQSRGVTAEGFIAALKSYLPLRHRLEYIGTRDGVAFYDDSISTTAESTVSAIEAIPNAGVVLLGGMDRRIDYSALVSYLSSSDLKTVICMYQSGKRIFEMLREVEDVRPQVVYRENLREAVALALRAARAGEAVLLSPAAASYGDFRDFAERGDMFREMIFTKGD